MKRNNISIIIAATLILTAVFIRIFTRDLHLYNITPIAALGVFSGAVIKDKRLAFLLPLLGQFIADLYFQLFTNMPGFYGLSQLFTYGALLAAAWLGSGMAKPKPVSVLAYIFGGSALFFIISNLGVYFTGMYGMNISGLIETYVMGIPFFKYTMEGDMIGGIVLFGAYFLIQQLMANRMVKAKA